ncbi:MAG TPA: branched-chain amino acid ABC transporter permease [Gaiellaceae bacterium]|nr:branched-chain amino acid ABC transporter permease [Gaiellaceae bacterium]
MRGVRTAPRFEGGESFRRRVDDTVQLLGPLALVVVLALIASQTVNAADDVKFRTAIVNVAIVVALYVFVGNSGVLSFGQVSFVAVGAFAAGLLTVPADVKPGVLPQLFPFLRDHSISNPWSLTLAAGLGAVYALVVGVPLMRLSGLAAGIATFAVLGITYNILTYWTRIGPGATTLTLIPVTTDYLQATVGAVAVIAIAFAYQRSRWGRQLRATREDPAAAQAAGIDVHRQRLWAFVLSGALSGFAGGLLVHLPPGSITTNQVYLDLTFLTLAMLVVGGAHSLFGAVAGAIGISLVNILLQNGENGIHVVGWKISLPQGSSLVGVAIVMLVVLLLRPSGLTGGREFAIPRRLRRRPGAEPPAPAPEPGV